ncbi:hypothetical protein NVP1193O_213 [Vibrio phage 1.193.O._10N.286.52.C6]|nr:hypothetical protein NVP1193O_213 [Vibrio phage 1.193.O._10N.286.52.C6]
MEQKYKIKVITSDGVEYWLAEGCGTTENYKEAYCYSVSELKGGALYSKAVQTLIPVYPYNKEEK